MVVAILNRMILRRITSGWSQPCRPTATETNIIPRIVICSEVPWGYFVKRHLIILRNPKPWPVNAHYRPQTLYKTPSLTHINHKSLKCKTIKFIKCNLFIKFIFSIYTSILSATTSLILSDLSNHKFASIYPYNYFWFQTYFGIFFCR